MRRWLARLVVTLGLALVFYLLAGLAGGAIPANRGWQPPARGVRIYVEDNGIHTGLVLPVAAEGVDWRDLVKAVDIADPRFAAYDHIAFGWGDRAFYLGTPHWSDVKPLTVLAAAIGSGDTVVHVEHVPAPAVRDEVRAVVLTPDQYRRLAAYVRATFAPDASGRAPSVHGYGGYDAFYAARGHYSAFNTCNAWTGAALRAAGVKMGVWTPFPVTVMQWF